MTARHTELAIAAKRDLGSIAEYLLSEASVDGLRFLEELEQAIFSIADFPERFAVVGSLPGVTIRRRVCGPYLIFYLASNERIDVLRILHGAQDIESILFGEP